MGRCVAFKAQSRVVKLSLGLGKDEFRINCAHKLASM